MALTSLEITTETWSYLYAKHLKPGLKNLFECPKGDRKNNELKHGLWFLLCWSLLQ